MKTVINVKVDREIKDQAVQTAKDMSIPLSTIINAFLKRFINDRSVTFNAPRKLSKKLERVLRKADRDIKAGKNLSPVFSTVDDMMAYLNDPTS